MGLLDKLFGRDTPSQEIVGKVDKEGPRNPIDQLGVTGRSQRNAAYEDTAHIPRITDYVAEKLSQLLRYSTEMPVLRLTEDDSPAQITDSKLGGAFYVPEGMKAPRNLDTGDPLYLLAQLNFSQLPQLRGFPAQGLLQFFIDGEDTLYGADYDNPQSQRSWRVRYLPNVPVTALHANRVVKPAWHDDTVLPFNDPDTERRLVAQAGKQTITPTDYRFEGRLQSCVSTLNEYDHGFFREHEAEIRDSLAVLLMSGGHQVGGYPIFTQSDPHDDRDPLWNKATDLLLQIDSTNDVSFGDSGVANFFISPSDLERLDFSRMLYTWDCY